MVYRFSSHPRFAYWAFNMIQRKRILQQSGIFLKQTPGETHLTLDELREMAASNSATVFMSKVSRYVANIAGTDAYWNKVREELKAIITNVGAPAIFFTFSFANMYGQNSMHYPRAQRKLLILHDVHGLPSADL